MSREVIGTASVGQDAYNHGFREGKAEGIAEGKAEGIAETEAKAEAKAKAKTIECIVSSVLYLVNAEGWSLEKALSPPVTPAYIRDEVEKAVRKQLN